jgi:hypothetical protein
MRLLGLPGDKELWTGCTGFLRMDRLFISFSAFALFEANFLTFRQVFPSSKVCRLSSVFPYRISSIFFSSSAESGGAWSAPTASSIWEIRLAPISAEVTS